MGLAGDEIQADDSHHDHPDKHHPQNVGGFVEEDDAERRRSNRTNSSPDGVGGADGEGLEGLRQQGHADDEGDDGEDGGPEFREALGVFEADGPRDFEQPGDDEQLPRHGSDFGTGGGYVFRFPACRDP